MSRPRLAAGDPARCGQSAFTLIELLVVIVILGCLVGLVSLGVGDNRPRELQDEAQRLAAVIALLADEAVLDNREYGLRFDREGYSVQRFETACACWQPVPGERAHRLPDWARQQLELDSQPLQLAASRGGDDEGEESASASVPQLLLLSSGELSPFRLRLSLRDEGGPDFELRSDGFQLPSVERVGD